MRFIKKKFHMTLLEVLIAMSLLSVLLVIVFGFFRELSVLNTQTKERLKETFQQRYVESRLNYVFSHLVNENRKGKKFYFFSLRDEASTFPSLVFTFDNKSSLDTSVGGDVLGRLFLDGEQRLCLAVWPIAEKQKAAEVQEHQKMECLLENVRSVAFKFFSAPDAEKTIISQSPSPDKKEPPKGEWLEEWDKDYKQMPVIVKIEVIFKGQADPEIFSFVLPSSKNPLKFTAGQ